VIRLRVHNLSCRIGRKVARVSSKGCPCSGGTRIAVSGRVFRVLYWDWKNPVKVTFNVDGLQVDDPSTPKGRFNIRP
jgi:hypothetical protein